MKQTIKLIPKVNYIVIMSLFMVEGLKIIILSKKEQNRKHNIEKITLFLYHIRTNLAYFLCPPLCTFIDKREKVK